MKKNVEFWIETDDMKTYIAVVDKSRNLLVAKYPGIEFHIIFWDEGDDTGYNKAIIKALEKKKIKVHLLSSIKKKDDTWKKTGPFLILRDWHPTPLGHRVIASYVVDNIIGNDTEIPN